MDVLEATLRAIEAGNRPDASQSDLNALGQAFDQVSHHFIPSLIPDLSYTAGESILPIVSLDLPRHKHLLTWADERVSQCS